jgi:hypothetical protein
MHTARDRRDRRMIVGMSGELQQDKIERRERSLREPAPTALGGAFRERLAGAVNRKLEATHDIDRPGPDADDGLGLVGTALRDKLGSDAVAKARMTDEEPDEDDEDAPRPKPERLPVRRKKAETPRPVSKAGEVAEAITKALSIGDHIPRADDVSDLLAGKVIDRRDDSATYGVVMDNGLTRCVSKDPDCAPFAMEGLRTLLGNAGGRAGWCSARTRTVGA